MYDHDEEDRMTETDVMNSIRDLLLGEPLDCTLLDNAEARTFEDEGVLTYNKGLVIRTADGSEFKLTIVQSR